MTEAAQPAKAEEKEVFVLRSKSGKVFGPCSACAFFNPRGTKATHATGRCHGGPPAGMGGFAVVRLDDPGCAAFLAG
jgi:hypothetical protein